MAETLFPEKRTRSQVTLPDNVLHVADASPMKLARTALKNQYLDTDSPSRTQVTDSEDELLLSPNKKGKNRRKQTRSKRTASPPPQDEYSTGSHSSLDRRELKRAKRDSSPTGDPADTLVTFPQNPKILQLQSTTPTHNRTNSESYAPAVRRSNRKRSATINKPPPSTASASPPRTIATPPPSPGKGRAQSVPLFSTGTELPRVDFRKLPPSPKRARSRSRSPSKEREKLRMNSAPSIPTSRLPTIEDNEFPANMDVDEASSVPEEIELPHIYPTTMHVEPPSLPPITSPVESVPETPRVSPTLPPSQPITAIPFTPATQSLNKFIPLSPLTPLPETPWVTRVNAVNYAEGFEGRIGWGLRENTQHQPSADATSKTTDPVPEPAATSNSRLPRPPMAHPAPPPSKLQEGSTMPPPRFPPTRPQASTSKALAGSSQPKNAFDIMMGKRPVKNAERQKPLSKGKVIHTSSKPSQPTIFSSTKGKEKAVTPETGLKSSLKSKMKARSNVKEDKLVITVDEDEQDELEADLKGDTEEKTLAEGTLTSKTELYGNTETDIGKDDIKRALLGLEAERSQDQGQSQQEAEDVAGPAHDPVQEPTHSAAKTDGLEANGDDVPAEGNTHETPVAAPLSLMVEFLNNVAEPIDPSPEPQHGPKGVAQSVEVQQSTVEPEVPLLLSEGPSDVAQASLPAKAIRLPFGKIKLPSAPSVPLRVTRSVSKQKDAPESQPVQKPLVRPQTKSKPPLSTAVNKRKAAVGAKKEAVKSTPTSVESSAEESVSLPPGSPMKITTPGKPLRTSKSFERLAGPSTSPIRLSMAKTPATSRILTKPMSTPSPAKIARSATTLASKPSVLSITRTFSMGVGTTSSNAGSTLSTLSNALEKLRMPPPSRPNTSMGFNRGPTDDDSAGEGPSLSQDDATVGRTSIGLGSTESTIQRSATLGSNLFKPTIASSNKVAAATAHTKKNMVQKPLSMFMGRGAAFGGANTGAGTSKFGGKLGMGAKPLFANAPPRRTISKKTSLPTLIGSPVKGGKAPMTEEDINMADDSSHPQEQDDVSMSAASGDSSVILEGSILDRKGKAPASRSMLPPSSRILSVSHALTESLSALPRDTQPAKGGIMGPPATPPKKNGVRGTSGTSVSSGSPSTGGGVPTRSSSRIAKAAHTQSEHVAGPSTKKDLSQTTALIKESLNILNDCVIFVDVKTDDGEEAGSLFVKMLEGVGAKVLGRVGQSCTHIVYKNGHSSTFTRYKLLRDPKPLVVGIGWVVECVEKRKHVEENNFLVDLDTMNATSNNKRRRSILPRLLSDGPSVLAGDADREEDGDISMDGSTSSITIDDGITPLEKARRRQSVLPSRA